MDRPAPRPPRGDPLATPEGRQRSGMIRTPGILYHLAGFSLLLRRLRIEDHSVENIRRAHEAGPLVYVLHTRSLLDWLALNRVLNERRLPLARLTCGVRSTWLKPLRSMAREWWSALRRRLRGERLEDPLASGLLADALARGVETCLFLVRPPRVRARFFRRLRRALGAEPPDPVPALLDAQERSERPIQLVPVVVVWRRAPETARSEAARLLLGAEDQPGPLQKLAAVLLRTNRAVVQAGRPVDLRELMERVGSGDRRRQARVASILLRRYLVRESLVVRGPRIRPLRWTKRRVLGSPEVRALVAELARETGRDPEAVRQEVERTFDHMAARPSFTAVQLADHVCRFLFNRIFSGVDIRPEDVERLRSAMRDGTPVLVPCHRSHLDYLLVSWVLYQHDIVVPHVIAGENLSFWPLGPIFRRLGAVFIKRSFRGERVFPVVFQRYLRQIIRDGHPLEFYIEGGRSRTGKLLPPRLGVLGMVLDAAVLGREDRPTTLLPVAISYEQIAEEKAYARELSGASKERENIRQVVRARKVLRRRYGKVHIRVGEPLPCNEVFAAAPAPWPELDGETRRELLQHTGERLMYRIAQSMVLLPTGLVAMALLAGTRRGVRMDALHARVARLDALLRARGAQPAASLSYGGWAVEEAVRRFEQSRFIRRLADADGDILQIEEDRRITLEYYKNGILHFVAPTSLVAGTVVALQDGNPEAVVAREAVVERFRTLVFLLRYEFTLDPERSFEAIADEAIATLVDAGALAIPEEGEAIAGRDAAILDELAAITRNFLESYALVLRAAQALKDRAIPPDELPRHVQETGKGLLAVDEVRFPESLSIANLRNAIKAFREEGVFTPTEAGGWHVDQEAIAHYRALLRAHLGG